MQEQPGSRVADSVGEVSERVREVIGKAGCSQREFARRIVMDPSKLSRSLSGSRRFTVAELARIADAGRVDAGWLLGSGTEGGATAPVPSAAHRGTPVAKATAASSGATASPGAPPSPGAQTPSAVSTAAAAPGGGRPLQIVRETVRLIARHGFHAVRVADIAEACATSTAAIHYHFPGRAELLEAAVRWCMDEDTARRSARIAEAGDAADELRQLIELQTPATARQRQQWLVWLDLWAEAARSTAIGGLHVEYYRQWRTTVADVLRRGMAQGVFREVDPEFSALRLTAMIDGLAAQVLASAPSADPASPEPASPDSAGTDPAGPDPAAGPVPDRASRPASVAGPSDVSASGQGRPADVPYGGGTSADDMRTALLAYVETELSAETVPDAEIVPSADTVPGAVSAPSTETGPHANVEAGTEAGTELSAETEDGAESRAGRKSGPGELPAAPHVPRP